MMPRWPDASAAGKTCTVCGECKPLEAYYRQTGGRGGVRAICRACSVLYIRRQRAAYAARNGRPTRTEAPDADLPWPCRRCGRTLKRRDFNRSAGSKGGLQHACRPCHAAQMAARAAKIRERSGGRDGA